MYAMQEIPINSYFFVAPSGKGGALSNHKTLKI
jgi:hypothetical protein